MPFKGAYVRARIHIPHTNGVVRIPPATTNDGAAIWTERHAIDTVNMPFKGAYEGARIRIPQADSTVITATSEGAAIWAERHAYDSFRMPREQCDLLTGGRIVEPNTDAARHRELSPIG